MTTSNWIELAVIAVVFGGLAALRIVTKHKLDSIDGLGSIKKKKDVKNTNVIDL